MHDRGKYMVVLRRGLSNMRLVNKAQEGLLPKGQTRVVKKIVMEVQNSINNIATSYKYPSLKKVLF